jgi:hypothetical protein
MHGTIVVTVGVIECMRPMMLHDLQVIEEPQLAGSAPLRRARRRAAACTALVWVVNVEYKTPCAVCSLVAIH